MATQDNDQDIAGINIDAVSAWLDTALKDAGIEASTPYSFSLVATGQSNMTFIVEAQNGFRFVLRRPPLHQVLATAHDMVREFTIISALHPTGFPVPEPIALCEDQNVLEFPFYIMEFVEGTIISDFEVAKTVPMELKEKAGASLSKTLAELHSFDPDELGLSAFAKKADYIPRQLHRWLKQFKQSKTAQSPDIEKIHDVLVDNIPEQKYSGIVHGDYRLDNCVLDPVTGEVKAVLDWEICTLGDTLADIGVFATYWGDQDEEQSTLFNSATSQPGFIGRKELIQKYIEASGRNIADQIDYYLAFALWRLVCILQGVYSRYLDDAMPGKEPPGGMENLKSRINELISKSWTYLEAIK